MGIITSIQRVLGFTRNEIRAILFLSITFSIGVGIRWFNGIHRSETTEQFDYSIPDSVFAERSARILTESPPPAQSRTKSSGSRQLKPGSVDINAASKDELMLLPGIGKTYAERIIHYRQTNGPFRATEDLLKVKGIGRKTLARIREYIKPIASSP